RAAAESSDWARAAGYYAASRVQEDSREGRWGVALAREKMPRRVLARSGPERSFVDVGYLADGRALVIGVEPRYVVGREVESGHELWRFEHTDRIDVATVVARGQVRLVSAESTRYLDGATGQLLGTLPNTELPCPQEAVPSRVRLRQRAEGQVELVAET